jgi:hypothetical protein
MWVTVGHLLRVDPSGETLNSSACVTGLTNILEVVAVALPMTDAVETRLFGDIRERVCVERFPLGTVESVKIRLRYI